jgi:hypothetical protein
VPEYENAYDAVTAYEEEMLADAHDAEVAH